jgi:hypothetical protein
MGNIFKRKKIVPIETLEHCVICLDYYNVNNNLKLPCNHIYHEKCFIELINKGTNNLCPICRYDTKKFILKFNNNKKLKENIFMKFTMLFINSVLIVPLSWCIGTFFSAGIIFGVVGLGLSIYLTFMIFKY